MTVNQVIWIMFFWVATHYLVARSVLARINRVDPEYFEMGSPDGKLPIGMSTSFVILKMLWDSDLPGTEYGNFVRFGLYFTRILGALCIPVAIILFYCTDWSTP